MKYEHILEAMAASDAKFDGRDYQGMSLADRKRYELRCAQSLGAAAQAMEEADKAGFREVAGLIAVSVKLLGTNP